MNSRKLRDFDDKYSLVLDSQDREGITHHHPIGKDCTGFMVLMGDGEYREVWGSEDAAPYTLSATYELMVKDGRDVKDNLRI